MTHPLAQAKAETVAAQALAWIAGEADLLQVFLGATGASESDVKTQMAEPAFLGSVLDFLMMDDDWVVRFCDTVGLAYDQPMRARAGLPGGAQVHWT